MFFLGLTMFFLVNAFARLQKIKIHFTLIRHFF